MKSLREKSFEEVIKGKSLRQILDWCEENAANMDACFPNVQSVKDLLLQKMPAAARTLHTRFDLVTIEDHIEFARALIEGRCTKYGILVDSYGCAVDSEGHQIYKPEIKLFYEFSEPEQVAQLIIDGHPPQPGTICYLFGILENDDDITGSVDYDWYAFAMKTENIQDIMIREMAIRFADKILREEDPMSMNIIYGEHFGDDENDEHHGIDITSDDLADLLMPFLEKGTKQHDFPTFNVRCYGEKFLSFWIQTHFTTFPK